MAVKTFNPTTPSLRSMQILVHKAEITTDKPERSLESRWSSSSVCSGSEYQP